MSEIIGKIGMSFNAPDREPEVPEFIIENDDEETQHPKENDSSFNADRWKKWLRRLLKAFAIALMVVLIFFAWNRWNYFKNIGVPISTTPAENIKKLQMQPSKEKAGVVFSSDSILGVALDFYAIHGLRASIEFEEPDTADTSIFLYCRSADHQADGKYIGSLVVNGEEKQSDRSRLGYMGMVDDRMVIGISRFEDVKNYCQKNGGSFFRQFMLISKGENPGRFAFKLRGKVERRAIGRKGDTLYYIATRHKESLYDFAEALSEYGFIDAIYITGGTDYCFYRTADGERHDIGNIKDYPHKKWKGIIPWLVFRAR